MHAAFIIFVLIDQITKTAFADRDFLLLGMYLHPARNYGLPFGLDFGAALNVFLLALVYVVVGWFVLRLKFRGAAGQIGKAVFLAGAASNLADRLIYGYVRDFIDLRMGFVFNFADIFIVLGLVMVAVFREPKQAEVEKPNPTGKT